MLGVLYSIEKKKKLKRFEQRQECEAGQEVSVNRRDQESLIKKIIFRQKSEVSEKVSHAVVWEKSFLGRRSSHCKDCWKGS